MKSNVTEVEMMFTIFPMFSKDMWCAFIADTGRSSSQLDTVDSYKRNTPDN